VITVHQNKNAIINRSETATACHYHDIILLMMPVKMW